MIHAIEEFGQIHIDDHAVSRRDEGLSLADRVVLRPFRPEPKAGLREGVVPDALKDLGYRLLEEPIQNGRNAEHSLAALGLWYQLLPDGQGRVAPM